MKTMKYITITLLATSLLTSCGGSPEQSQAAAAQSQQPETESPSDAAISDSTMLADAVTGATAVSNTVSFNGTLVVPAQNRVSITLPMGGIVKNMKHLPGAYVNKGELIAIIENAEFISLQQTYLDSYAQAEYLESEYLRQQTLAQQEAASQKKLQQSKADFLSMKSRKDAAAAQLSLLGLMPVSLIEQGIKPHIEVRAPIAGYISDMQMNSGKYFNAGEPLCEVTNKSTMLLKLVAYEKDLAKLKTGIALDFHINGVAKTVFKAVITSIGQQINATNSSLDVYATVSTNHDQFRHGMYVTATVSQK